MILKLYSGPSRDVKEPRQFTIRSSATSFRNVGANRGGCATHLGSQSKQFFPREFSCRPIYGNGQFMCLYPNLQIIEIMHEVSVIRRFLSKMRIPNMRIQRLRRDSRLGAAFRSSSQNSSPATAAPSRLTPVQRARRRSLRRTFRFRAFPPVRRCASTRRASEA